MPDIIVIINRVPAYELLPFYHFVVFVVTEIFFLLKEARADDFEDGVAEEAHEL